MRNKLLFLAIMVVSQLTLAQSFRGIPVEAYITKPDGSPLTTSNFSAVAQLISPSECIMFEEFYSNLSVTNGAVNLTLGKGQRTAGDPGLAMDRLLSNAVNFSGLNSTSGDSGSCVYQPSAQDSRTLRLKLYFDGETVVADFSLKSVPYAVIADEARTLQGLTPDSLIKTNPGIGLNQANFERMFNSFQSNTISPDSIAPATTNSRGVVQVGTGLNVTSGVLSIAQGGITGDMISSQGIPVSKVSGAGLLAYKNTISDLDITGYISSNKILGLGLLAFKSKVTDSDIDAQSITPGKINGLGALALKSVVSDGDIAGPIANSKISGLGTFALKNSITEEDITGNISLTKVSGLKTLAGLDFVGANQMNNTDLSTNWDASVKSLSVANAASIGTNLTITGNNTIGGTLAVTGNTTLGGTLGVTGAVSVSGNIAGTGQISGASNTPTYAGSGDLTLDLNAGNTILIPSNFTCASGTYINLTNYKVGSTYSLVVQDTSATQCNFKVNGTAITSSTMKFSPANTTRPSGTQSIYSVLVVRASPVLMYTAWSAGFQ